MLRIATFLEAIESLFMVLLDFVDIIVTGSFELNFHEDWIEARIVVDHVLLLPPPLCLNWPQLSSSLKAKGGLAKLNYWLDPSRLNILPLAFLQVV